MGYPTSFVFGIIILFQSSRMCISKNHQHYQSNNQPKLKSLHFTVYVHETYNKTAYLIVKGVVGPKSITKESSPLGSLVVYNDPLTETPDPSSKVLGYMEGSSMTSSFNGDRATCIYRTSLKNIKGYKGELIHVGTAYYTQASELPLVGGTGDFRFAQGYLKFSVVDLSGPATCYKTEFYLYWPPYAAFAH